MWQTTAPSLLLRLRDPEDHAAWFDFERRYGELILRYCGRLGLGRTDAEEVRQIVLLSLARTFPRFAYAPERGRFRSYLAATVRRAVGRYRERPMSGAEHLRMDEALAGDAADALSTRGEDALDPLWEEEWRRHHLRRALGRVRKTFDPQSIDIFERLLGGEPVAEIARALSVSDAVVYKTKQRLRDALRALVTRQVEDEERSFG